ncbi:ATP-binding protein [Streptomyces sp. NBC_01696]|uniref:ATP-binding protein n=1 Tax=unclassified Streptomyces TaxID=2593676 RepID=UPI0029B32EBE|nr:MULTISPECIES: ATP-binding protein [unclassified Streptomyces]MDX3683889.1 ATP-binding protein [Streptomyces sp. AK04-4c]
MAMRQESPPMRLYRRLGYTDLSAVGETRAALREFLRYRRRPEETEVAELLLSELVTNALIHTRNGAVVTVTSAPARLRVEVRDFVTGQEPAPYVPNADDGTHGRGLFLVQSLADSWGVMTQALGKVVWFELNAGTA